MKESDGFIAVLLFSKVHKGTTFDGKKLHTKDQTGPVKEFRQFKQLSSPLWINLKHIEEVKTGMGGDQNQSLKII